VVGEINGHSEIPADAEVLEEGDGDGESAETEEVEETYDESGTILDDVEPSAEAESEVGGETTVDAEIQAPDETSPVKRSRSVESDEPDEEVIKGKKAKIDGKLICTAICGYRLIVRYRVISSFLLLERPLRLTPSRPLEIDPLFPHTLAA
jgi:hypothetical protein